MIYSTEIQHMCRVTKGPDHGPAPIPQEGRWVQAKEIKGSSSVPAHVEMMGFLGMGNNPMVGASVAVAVALEQAKAK